MAFFCCSECFGEVCLKLALLTNGLDWNASAVCFRFNQTVRGNWGNPPVERNWGEHSVRLSCVFLFPMPYYETHQAKADQEHCVGLGFGY